MKISNIKISKRMFNKEKFILLLTTSILTLTSCSSLDTKNTVNSVSFTATPIEQAYEDQPEKSLIEEVKEPKVVIEELKKIDEVIVEPTPVEEEIKTVNFLAVGDNLIHGDVYKSGKQSDGTYNFDSFFENIQEELEWADIKVINQETILVKDESNYSGYPAFGSPYAIGESIVEAGFNVVLHATNHTFDKKTAGIEQTLSFWKKYKDQVTVLGIHEDEKDYNTIDVIEVNGIKIAMLNYTYGLNGYKLPSDKPYLTNTLYDKKKVIKDIKKADKLAALTIVFVHWGSEYVYDETDYQIDYANIMAEAGADIIVGAHPHVVEPLKYITTKDSRIVPVYYSLGNFISNQDKDPRMLGAMAKIVITECNEEITLDCEMLPIVTHKDANSLYTSYMLEDYTDKLGKKHKRILNLPYLYNLWNEIVEDENEMEFKGNVKKIKNR